MTAWRIIHGCAEDWLETQADKLFDVGIHDPPYSAAVHARSIRRTYLPDVAGQPCRRMRKYDFGFECITSELQTKLARQFARVTRRWTLVFSDTETAHSWKLALEDAGLDVVRYGFWVKDRAMPQISGDRPGSRVEQITIAHPKGRKRWNGGGLGNVWQHPVVVNCNGHRSDRIHTAQKPESLMLELMVLFSNEGELVLDATCGSGTTGVAAIKLGRSFCGIDKDAACAELARERLAAIESGSSLQAARAGQVPLVFGKA